MYKRGVFRLGIKHDVCECVYSCAYAKLGTRRNREIFSIYAQIQFGTNARGDYKYQFSRNIQRDIQLRHAQNRQRAARELRAEFIKFTAPFPWRGIMPD